GQGAVVGGSRVAGGGGRVERAALGQGQAPAAGPAHADLRGPAAAGTGRRRAVPRTSRRLRDLVASATSSPAGAGGRGGVGGTAGAAGGVYLPASRRWGGSV